MKLFNLIKTSLLFLLLISCLKIYGIENKTTFTIGFGSCIDEYKPQEIWSAVEKEGLNDFFFLGDNVYGDSDSGELNKMRTSYEKQASIFPQWLKKLSPIAIWDDHDYGLNDGGVEYRLKRESQKLFLDFWKVDKKDRRHNQEGIYFSEKRILNDKKILLIGLDTRYFRSALEGEKRNYKATKDETKTILGPRQWKWLESKFKEDVDIVILASSIQILASNHGFEKWSNFPHEKKRLLNLIEGFNKPVLLISGDRHKSGIYKKGNLYEITSSSLNKPLPRLVAAVWNETDPLLLGKMHYNMNYGLIKINSRNIKMFLKDEKGIILEKAEFDI
ncbi:MAG: phosphatase [Chloroflexi bacterium]|nr:phosphatase [Chloroflexota bacterium]|tara:strand:- start:4969 stop:5964 length:996 start_codon:yes stop_codon:yes gene_type:complete